MASGLSEPMKAYWAIGIAASLALHASGVAGAVLLADRYAAKPVQTEINFSGEVSPSAMSVPSQSEVATVSAIAAVAEPERLAPVAAELPAKQASEALRPLETEPVQATEQEALAPSGAEAAATPLAETVRPLDSDVAAADREQGTRLVAEVPQAVETAAAETLSSAQLGVVEKAFAEQPEAVAGSSGDAIQPATASEALAGADQEVAAAASESDSVAVSESAEQVASSAPSGTASSSAAAETIAALEQPAADGAVTAAGADHQAATATAERLAAETAGTSGGATSLSASGTQTEVLGPVAATQGADQEQGISIPGGQETVAPIEPPLETALLVPARPGSVLGTEVDKPSDRYRRIVDFVRGYAGGDCFIALPAISPGGEVTFQTFGRDKVREDAFRNALLGFDGFQAEISSGDIADSQCMALAFARDVRRYPGFSLMIDLGETDLASGARLSGSVLNAKGRELHLLLVDNDGVVQSIDRFLKSGDGTDRPFSAPLVLTGGPVVTKQILIAIATDGRLAALAEPVNEPASQYFRRLSDEIVATGADIDLAVEGFSVR